MCLHSKYSKDCKCYKYKSQKHKSNNLQHCKQYIDYLRKCIHYCMQGNCKILWKKRSNFLLNKLNKYLLTSCNQHYKKYKYKIMDSINYILELNIGYILHYLILFLRYILYRCMYLKYKRSNYLQCITGINCFLNQILCYKKHNHKSFEYK